jgi:hypothetical protein
VYRTENGQGPKACRAIEKVKERKIFLRVLTINLHENPRNLLVDNAVNG